MNFIFDSRIARAARHIAARLETEPEVFLTLPHDWHNVNRLDRIIAYMQKYCGSYYVSSSVVWNYLIIRKQG